ncbi:unnamed protein product [Adineta steineri]|uniref:Uncharacterized protein n=1 Tax=Adineta steineri TaxID=433720 RepID=A0A819KMQ6_9BILA|nr:unnamed protein product [Adineta steineri]
MEGLTIKQQNGFTYFVYDKPQENSEQRTVIIGENREDKQGNVIGYNCIYRYDITIGYLEQLSNQNKLTLPSISKEEHIPEDVIDYGSRSEFNDLAPPLVAPRRSRQNSACSICSTSSSTCSSTSCYRINPFTCSTKKKTFEKIVDIIKRRETITMFDLGLRFLRVYDGNFNYREGHEITYVDCSVGDIEPRSALILNYKGQYTNVHI